MKAMEFCELWLSEGGNPLLTFYRPSETNTVTVTAYDWNSLKSAMDQLGLLGWELLSVSQGRLGWLFQRHLQ